MASDYWLDQTAPICPYAATPTARRTPMSSKEDLAMDLFATLSKYGIEGAVDGVMESLETAGILDYWDD